MFDVIKVDLLRKTRLQSHAKYARATIKLSLLAEAYSLKGTHVLAFPLLDAKDKKTCLGSVSLLLHFYDFYQNNLLTPDMTGDFVKHFNDGLSSLNVNDDDDLQHDDLLQSLENHFNEREDSSFGTTAANSSSRRSDSLDSQSHSSATTSSNSITFLERDQKLRSESLSSISYRKQDPSREEESFDVASLAAGFFKTGWDMSSIDIVRGIRVLGRYYKTYTTPKTGERVDDLEMLVHAQYFLKFLMPSYGPFLRKVFGHGTTLDMIQPSRKVVIKHLELQEEDLLVWQYESSKVLDHKPCFFICYDRHTHSIHICVRGTFSVADVLTDINAEYVPFLNGTAHKGVLTAALWIRDHYLEEIVQWVQQMDAHALYFSGHSLGGSIASLLLMLVRDRIHEEFGTDFVCKAFAYASAPCVSSEVISFCAPFKQDMICFLNKHDPVPLLSYGAMMDLKEMIKEAARVSKDASLDKQQQVQVIYHFAARLRASNKHPRLLIPGNLYFMYKRKQDRSLMNGTKAEYIIEKSIPEHFDQVHLKFDMMYHHFPSMYENTLNKAIECLRDLKQ